jgi:hypothetical protein
MRQRECVSLLYRLLLMYAKFGGEITKELWNLQ